MTSEMIKTMKPGRDLDILIALEIMGYMWMKHALQFSAEMAVKWIGAPGESVAMKGVYIPAKPEEVHALKCKEDYAEQVPRFSTEWASAQTLVEKMKAAGYEYDIVQKDNESWVATFRGDDTTWEIQAQSEAEATAKAAVLAQRRI